jgi:pilus assembly protein Flp/PilA
MIRTIRKSSDIAKNDEGASAVEYGLLVAAIAALIVLIVFVLGGSVKGAFQDTCDGIEGGGTTNANGTTCADGA